MKLHPTEEALIERLQYRTDRILHYAKDATLSDPFVCLELQRLISDARDLQFHYERRSQ